MLKSNLVPGAAAVAGAAGAGAAAGGGVSAPVGFRMGLASGGLELGKFYI